MNAKINKLALELANEISKLENVDDKINTLNHCRKILHEVSPLKHHPADFTSWEKVTNVGKNEYNPNKFAPPESKLLAKSIIEDGYTMSVVTYIEIDEEGNVDRKIVDGENRTRTCRENKEIQESTFGRVPVTTIRSAKKDISNRMASTIRHNRARGSHDVGLMVKIVGSLVEYGMSDNWIIKNIGMDKDEILRLKQISGLASLFTGREFSKAWE